jgi:hypothetical protein
MASELVALPLNALDDAELTHLHVTKMLVGQGEGPRLLDRGELLQDQCQCILVYGRGGSTR